jgi:hypothetical protein
MDGWLGPFMIGRRDAGLWTLPVDGSPGSILLGQNIAEHR